MPYALAILAVNAAVGLTLIGYAGRRYADYSPTMSDLISSRGLLYLACLTFMSSGFLRAVLAIDAPEGSGDGFTGGSLEGAYWGLISFPVSVPLGLAIAIYVKRSESDADDALDEDEF